MKAVRNNTSIAESDATVVAEGSYYHFNVAGKQNTDAACYYAEPLPGAKQVAGRAVFCRVIVRE